MAIINKPRGTYDIFGETLDLFNYVSQSLKDLSRKFNIKEMITPIFEHKELFVRNIGENSDIVTKEFYDFKDKGNRDIVLRPENTVGIIRSVIENKLINTNPFPQKYFYIGPMFRYERPQNGRFRQFYQFGIEYIGIKNFYEQIEVILFGIELLKVLEIKNYKLKINYIGGFNSRQKWIDELTIYFKQFENELSNDSKKRLSKNPLRILDDKIDGKKDFVINCPKIDLFLTSEEREEYNNILNLFKEIKIDFEVDKTLVRGLDYYTGLVFEFVSLSDNLTGQSTLIGGGKYSKLTRELGSENYDCIGFGMGIERIMIEMQNNKYKPLSNSIDVYFMTFKLSSIKEFIVPIKIVSDLRRKGLIVETNFDNTKIDKKFKQASKFNPKYIMILGNKELEENVIILKDQKEMKEVKLNINNLETEIKKIF